MDILEGRMLSDQDIINKNNVILVTESFVTDYLKTSNKNALGMDVLINDQYFSII
jgi:hypothetical protein